MTLASIAHVLPDFTRKLGLSSDLMVLGQAWDHEAGSMRELPVLLPWTIRPS